MKKEKHKNQKEVADQNLGQSYKERKNWIAIEKIKRKSMKLKPIQRQFRAQQVTVTLMNAEELSGEQQPKLP
jgi:hypothetical protein